MQVESKQFDVNRVVVEVTADAAPIVNVAGSAAYAFSLGGGSGLLWISNTYGARENHSTIRRMRSARFNGRPCPSST